MKTFLESSNGVDLDGDGAIGIPFTGGVVTLGEVVFGTTQFGYGFNDSNPTSFHSVVLIRNALNPSSGYASDSNPGAGWIAAGVSSVREPFKYWKNTGTQQYARWDVDFTGASSNAVLISYDEFMSATASLKSASVFAEAETLSSDTSNTVIYLASGGSAIVLIGAISAIVIIFANDADQTTIQRFPKTLQYFLSKENKIL
jgi:hypothetical protein